MASGSALAGRATAMAARVEMMMKTGFMVAVWRFDRTSKTESVMAVDEERQWDWEGGLACLL
jgi:hypothetical protein